MESDEIYESHEKDSFANKNKTSNLRNEQMKQ